MVEGGPPASYSDRSRGPTAGRLAPAGGATLLTRGRPLIWLRPNPGSRDGDGVCCWTARAGERTGAWGVIPAALVQQGAPTLRYGGWGVPVAESVLAPPGPIPNPVVTQRSAGEYCGGDPTGGEAAAGTPHPRRRRESGRRHTRGAESRSLRAKRREPAPAAGWSSGSSLGS
jgi:hypothetical protein